MVRFLTFLSYSTLSLAMVLATVAVLAVPEDAFAYETCVEACGDNETCKGECYGNDECKDSSGPDCCDILCGAPDDCRNACVQLNCKVGDPDCKVWNTKVICETPPTLCNGTTQCNCIWFGVCLCR